MNIGFPKPAKSGGCKALLLGVAVAGFALVAQAQFVPGTNAYYTVIVDRFGAVVWPTNVNFGAGSGFPLTNAADFAWNGALRVAYINETNPAQESFLSYSGTGYVHRYTVRVMTNYLHVAAAQAASNSVTLYPGQLMRYADGDVYQLGSTLYGTNYVPFTTNSFPWPGVSALWSTFVEQGATGATGASGSDGADGIGNLTFSPWDPLRAYIHDTNNWPLVTDDGRLYYSVQSSTNKQPSGVGGSNYWSIAVNSGADGAITWSSNWVDRGTWNSGDSYATNHLVTYVGNLFLVGETNVQPAVGVAPNLDSDGIGINSAFWTLKVARGAKGATGATGASGAVTYWTNIVNEITVIDTNAVFLNTPGASNDVIVFQGSAGQTNYYRWIAITQLVAGLTGAGNVTNIGTGLYGNGTTDPLRVDTSTVPFRSEIHAAVGSQSNRIDLLSRAESLAYAVPISGGWATLSVTNGPFQRLVITTNTILTVNTLAKSGTNYVGMIRLDIYNSPATNWISFYTGTISSASASNIVFSTNAVNSLLLDSPAYYGNDLWDVRLIR